MSLAIVGGSPQPRGRRDSFNEEEEDSISMSMEAPSSLKKLAHSNSQLNIGSPPAMSGGPVASNSTGSLGLNLESGYSTVKDKKKKWRHSLGLTGRDKEKDKVQGSSSSGSFKSSMLFEQLKSKQQQKELLGDENALPMMLKAVLVLYGMDPAKQIAFVQMVDEKSKDLIKLNGQEKIAKLSQIATMAQNEIKVIERSAAATVIQAHIRTYDMMSKTKIYRAMKDRNEQFVNLLRAERLYTKQLTNVYEFYMKPMVARAKTNASKQFSLEDVQCIYTGMEELVELHKALIVDLESLFTQYPNIFGLGESFLALGSKFQVYELYVQNLKLSVDTLNRCRSDSTWLNEFLTKTAKEAEGELADLLRAPARQLSRYIKFLSGMIDATPAIDLDSCFGNRTPHMRFTKSLQQDVEALAFLKKMEAIVGKAFDRSADRAALQELNRKLVGYNLLSTATANRKLISEGDATEKKKESRHYFIFNDLLLVASKNKDDDTYKVRYSCEFKDLTLKELDSDGVDFLQSGKSIGTLQMASGQKRKEFMQQLNRAIKKNNNEGKVFGVDIADVVKREDTVNGIPQIVQMATEFILQGDNAKLEGIFRVSGNQQHVKDLKAVFDKGQGATVNLAEFGPHTVSGLLKEFFREMPDSVLPASLYPEFMKVAGENLDLDATEAKLKALVHQLPQENLKILRYLIEFLTKIMAHEAVNQMGAQNLAIVFAPNILKPQFDNQSAEASVAITRVNRIVQCLIENFAMMFGEEAK
jgi:hypothetical protein